jgi:hypothetical protein
MLSRRIPLLLRLRRVARRMAVSPIMGGDGTSDRGQFRRRLIESKPVAAATAGTTGGRTSPIVRCDSESGRDARNLDAMLVRSVRRASA